jgi:large subunit ribosomal protein L6
MSRIGKKIIKIPSDVLLNIIENTIIVEGKFGKLTKKFLPYVIFQKQDNELNITSINDSKKAKSYHGLCRTLISNMVLGVNEQFSKTLIANGIGYKFNLDGNFLVLNMGYTHPVKFNIIPNIKISLDSPTKITIQGIDKELVGLFASKVRDVRPPEPYKGKGISYLNEKIKRKTGKK